MKTTIFFLSSLILLASCSKVYEYRTLKADFLVEDTLIMVGENLDLKNTSDSISVNYVWEFGDGQSSIEKVPIHYYASPGHYTIKLQVNDNSGNTNSIEQNVRVGERYIYEIELLTIEEKKYFSPTDFWDEDSIGNKALPDIRFAIMGYNDYNQIAPLYETRVIYNISQNNLPIAFQIPDIKITSYNNYEMGVNSFGLFFYDVDVNTSEEMMSNWMSGVTGSNYFYNKIEDKGEFTIGIFGSFKVKFKIK
jgi:hypothetical protein